MSHKRTSSGEAISPGRRTSSAVKSLTSFIEAAANCADDAAVMRGRAVLGYIEKNRVSRLSAELGVPMTSIYKWLRQYNAGGVKGLLALAPSNSPPPRPTSKLLPEQVAELKALLQEPPFKVGAESCTLTGSMVARVIETHFGARYNPRYLPVLLRRLNIVSLEKTGKLNGAQLAELAAVLRDPPASSRYGASVWTGEMIADWIQSRFGVRYTKNYTLRLLRNSGIASGAVIDRSRQKVARPIRKASATAPRLRGGR